MVAAWWIANGIANAAVMILPLSILADIIDHGELIEGERRGGAYVAIYNLLFKIGLALGVGLSFGLLELVHYDPSAAHYSATDVRNIRLVGFGLPSLLLVPAILLIWKHPITRKIQQQLRKEIDARNGLC
jgi:Na+/melibiose symporter-like transporter